MSQGTHWLRQGTLYQRHHLRHGRHSQRSSPSQTMGTISDRGHLISDRTRISVRSAHQLRQHTHQRLKLITGDTKQDNTKSRGMLMRTCQAGLCHPSHQGVHGSSEPPPSQLRCSGEILLTLHASIQSNYSMGAARMAAILRTE